MSMRIRTEQAARLAQTQFIQKLDGALSRRLPDFASLPMHDRLPLVVQCLDAAERRGLRSEQGLASYALAAWFLGVGFETRSARLLVLLTRSLPEVRRVYAMNEWVRLMIGAPDEVAAADAVLVPALQRTAAWGAA